MDTKRIQPENITKFTRTRKTLYTRRRYGHTVITKFIHIATENLESEANQHLDKRKSTFISLTVDGRSPVQFKIRSKAFDRCKSGHPSFKYFTNGERTKMITLIRMYGSTSSKVLAYAINLGLNPRQIGAIRRWHVATWRVLSPKM